MSKAELLKKLRGIPKDKQAAVTCALVGHSLIVSGCFGYVYCGRCEAQIGDQLASGFNDADKSVRIGHNCKTCRANFKKLDWTHKFLVQNPFRAKKATA